MEDDKDYYPHYFNEEEKYIDHIYDYGVYDVTIISLMNDQYWPTNAALFVTGKDRGILQVLMYTNGFGVQVDMRGLVVDGESKFWSEWAHLYTGISEERLARTVEGYDRISHIDAVRQLGFYPLNAYASVRNPWLYRYRHGYNSLYNGCNVLSSNDGVGFKKYISLYQDGTDALLFTAPFGLVIGDEYVMGIEGTTGGVTVDNSYGYPRKKTRLVGDRTWPQHQPFELSYELSLYSPLHWFAQTEKGMKLDDAWDNIDGLLMRSAYHGGVSWARAEWVLLCLGAADIKDGALADDVYSKLIRLVDYIKVQHRLALIQIPTLGMTPEQSNVANEVNYLLQQACKIKREVYHWADASFDVLLLKYPNYHKDLLSSKCGLLADGSGLSRIGFKDFARKVLLQLNLLDRSISKIRMGFYLDPDNPPSNWPDTFYIELRAGGTFR